MRCLHLARGSLSPGVFPSHLCLIATQGHFWLHMRQKAFCMGISGWDDGHGGWDGALLPKQPKYHLFYLEITS